MKTFVIIGLLASISLISCQSKDGDYSFFSEEDDLELGKQMAAQIDADYAQFPIVSRSQHPGLYQKLEKMRDQILKSNHILHRDEFAWELKVIDNDTIHNAFCTPGGFIYIYTGLIRFVESADELAGIMAHEIAHGDLRHSNDQMTKVYGIQVLSSIITGGEGKSLTNLGINLLGLRFSRGDEAEADAMAVRYLNDTDFKPQAFGKFFERMDSLGGSMGPLQFLSTHPNPENRVEKINLIWEQTGSKKGANHTKLFSDLIKSLP